MNSGNNRPNGSAEAYTDPLNNIASSGNRVPVNNESSGTVVFDAVNNEMIRHPQSGSTAFDSTVEAINKSNENGNSSTLEDNVRIYQNPAVGKQNESFAAPATQASDSIIPGNGIKAINNNSNNSHPNGRTPINAQNNAKTVPINPNPDSNRVGNTNTAGVMPQSPKTQGVPNAAKVMPKFPNNSVSAQGAPNNARVIPQVHNRNAGVQGNTNATRIIPQVSNRNVGAQGNPNATRIIPQVPNQIAGSQSNPNATRVIPRVPSQNAGTHTTPNATRIMPRVPNQISNTQGNIHPGGGVSYGNRPQSSIAPSGAVTNPANAPIGYRQNNGNNGSSNRSNLRGMESAVPAAKQNGTITTKSASHGDASKKKEKTKKAFRFPYRFF